jgi:hypothetical protein
MVQGVPAWAQGVFSIRFGGSEFKAPAAEAPTNGVHAHTNGHCATENGKAGAHEEARLKTFTGRATRVYGNSSRESGWTAEQHAGAGLPAPWAEHPAGAVLWVTGGFPFWLPTCQAASRRALCSYPHPPP